MGGQGHPASQGLVPRCPGTAETTTLGLQPTPASNSDHSRALNPGRDPPRDSPGGWPACLQQRTQASISAHLLSATGNKDPQFQDSVLGGQRASGLGAILQGPCLGPGQPSGDSLALFSHWWFSISFLGHLHHSSCLSLPSNPLGSYFLLNLLLCPQLSPRPSGPQSGAGPPHRAPRSPSSGTPGSAHCRPAGRWRRQGG